MGTYSSPGRERKGTEVTDAILQRLIPIVTAIQSSWNRTECLSPLCFLWYCALCCDALWFKDWGISGPLSANQNPQLCFPPPLPKVSPAAAIRDWRDVLKSRAQCSITAGCLYISNYQAREPQVFVSPWEYCNQLRVFFWKWIVKNGRQTSVVLLALFTSCGPFGGCSSHFTCPLTGLCLVFWWSGENGARCHTSYYWKM